MTGKTHDLAAFSALAYVYTIYPVTNVSLGTVLSVIGACFIGGLFPDLDQVTGNLWQKFPAGSILGRLFAPFFGGHRHISHSILGLFIFGKLAEYILNRASLTILVDMNFVWAGFMIGYISHLVMDLFTKEGVALLFPIYFKFGIPPISALRITTGKLMEKILVFPALLVADGYIFYYHYRLFLTLFHKLF